MISVQEGVRIVDPESGAGGRMTAEGSLTYSTRAVPFSVLAALRLYNKNVELQGDSALPKDAVPTLTLSDGCVEWRGRKCPASAPRSHGQL